MQLRKVSVGLTVTVAGVAAILLHPKDRALPCTPSPDIRQRISVLP